MKQYIIKSLIEKFNSNFLLYMITRFTVVLTCIVTFIYFMNNQYVICVCTVTAIINLTELICYIKTYLQSPPIALLLFRVAKIDGKIRNKKSMCDRQTQSTIPISRTDLIMEIIGNLKLTKQEIIEFFSNELLHRIYIRNILSGLIISQLVIYLLYFNEVTFLIWFITWSIKSFIDITNPIIILKAMDYPIELKKSDIKRKMGFYIVRNRLSRRKNRRNKFIENLFPCKNSIHIYTKYLKKLSVIPEGTTPVRRCDDYLIYK